MSDAIDYVTIGGESDTYKTIEEAINAQKYNIKLNADFELTKPVDVDKAVVLDLNGHKITNNSTYTYEDSGTTKTYDYILGVKRGGSLTVNDSIGTGEISSDSVLCAVKMTIKGETDGTNDSDKEAVLIVNGGILKGKGYAVSGNGTRHKTSVTVNGGRLTGKEGSGIYNPQDGSLTINGGEIEGLLSGVELRSGTLEITGGFLRSTSETYEKKSNGNGTTVTGSALAISQHTTKKDIKVTISGGTFEGVNSVTQTNVQEPDRSPSNVVLESISGGTFNGKVEFSNWTTGISGGTFSDFTAVPYLQSGANVTIKLTDNLTITDSDDDAATAEPQLKIPANTKVALDLNGKTLTFENKTRFYVEGELTVDDQSDSEGRIDSRHYIAKVSGTSGKFVLNKGQLTADLYGIYCADGASAEINGGSITSVDPAIAGNNTTATENFTVTGGYLKSTGNAAVFYPSEGNLKITGGTIEGKTGIHALMGTLNIEGGTIKGTADADDSSTDNIAVDTNRSTYLSTGSGPRFDGSAILLIPHKYVQCSTSNALTVNITGGNFESTNQNAISVYDAKIQETEFSFNISGGTFSTDPSEYIATGTVVKKDGTSEAGYTYTVMSSGLTEGIYLQDPTSLLGSYYYSTKLDDNTYQVYYYYPYSSDTSTTDQVLGTTTETDPVTGTVTETTETSEGTTIKETTTDGTVTETIKDTDGNTTKITVTETDEAGEVAKTTETVYNTDKSSVTTTTTASGIEQEVKVASDNSVTEVNVEIPEDAVEEGAVTLPAAVTVTDKSQVKTAPVVTITAPAGTQVTIPVNQDSSTIVVVKVNADGTEEIVKIAPEAEGAVVAPVDEDGVATYKVIDNAKTFSDVENGEWYTETVTKAAAREIMNGIGDTGTFAPNESTTRAMMAQILFNVDNAISTGTTANFTDLVDNAWYTDAVSWAAGAGVVTGYGDGNFDPEGNVTREQAITMIWRYAGKPSANTSALSKFSDAGNVSDYAKEALAWAAEVGILQGNNGQMKATDSATRAEIATLALRFCTL